MIMTHLLTPAEFAGWRIKLAKLNARAELRGFTGRLELTGRQVVVVTTRPPLPLAACRSTASHGGGLGDGGADVLRGLAVGAALDALPAAAGGAIGWV